MPPRIVPRASALALCFLPAAASADIVINEIYYDAEPNTSTAEFIEIFNSGPATVDLSGWAFSDGIAFTFPVGTQLDAGAYLVLTESLGGFAARFAPPALTTIDLADVVGGGDGSLPGTGSASGIDSSDGAVGTGGAGGNFDPVTAGDYYAVSYAFVDGVFVPNGSLGSQVVSTTRLTAGMAGAADASSSFGSWFNGVGAIDDPSSIGGLPAFSTDPANHSLLSAHAQKGITFDLVAIEAANGNRQVQRFTTTVGDSRQKVAGSVSYRILVDGALRASGSGLTDTEDFIDLAIAPGERFLTLVMGNAADGNGSDHGYFGDPFLQLEEPGGEGAPVTPQGEYSGGLSNEGETVTLRDASGAIVDTVDYRAESPWPIAANGGGVSMELINPSLDNDLSGSWRSATGAPTPGAENSVFATNAPPQVRQIDHFPASPTSGVPVVITAKATDPDGVQSLTLEFQIVAPGAYIPAYLAKPTSELLSNPNAPNEPNNDPGGYFDPATWTGVAMVPTAGDPAVFTATIPAQPNRTLVRYRIVARDVPGDAVTLPYPDDPSLNYAYFHYDGVPDFVANTRSVTGSVPTVHPKETLTALPVYHLIADASDLEQCIAYSGSDQIPSNNFDARSAFNWYGTFVYDGKVYDNMRYRLRQRNARYAGGGKRSFRFRFNDGRFIQFKDQFGNDYPTKWRTLNSHKMSARGGTNWGLYESANSVLWNLTGTPSPETHWFHFRVVDGAEEAPAGTNGQHLGDFYGLLLGMEDYDVRFLEAHDLERGNLYKLKSYILDGKEVQRYQAQNSVVDGSDYWNTIFNLRPAQSEPWIRQRVDMDAWNRYHAIVDAVRHYDVQPNTGEHLKNRSYYFLPPTPENPFGQLRVLPWDSDTSWGPNWNGGEDFVKFSTAGRPNFDREYKNVVREIRDLVWQEDQLQPLLETYTALLGDFVTADRDRWTGAPAAAGSQSDGAIEPRAADMLKFAFDGQPGATTIWTGGNDGQMDAISRDDNISGQQGRDAYLDALASDPDIPTTPTITYTGPAGFPLNALTFQSSSFADPQGAGSFAALEWRVAEVDPPAGAAETVIELGETWRYNDTGTDFGSSAIVAGSVGYDSNHWKHPDYDDSTWSTGDTPLGYGDGQPPGVALDFGPNAAQKYPTYYFRKTITIADPASIGSLTLRLRRDDGAIVYLNGNEIARSQMPDGEVLYSTLASGAIGEDVVYVFEGIDASLLVPGANTLAVEIHQRSLSNSDIVFDLGLDANPVPPYIAPDGSFQLVNFEWESEWESGPLASFNASVQVPAGQLRAGRSYRARVRHTDDTGRRSHWSAPVEFVAGLPDIAPLLSHLVVSEVMYHPTDATAGEQAAGFGNSDFEWIELHNSSPTLTLDLTDVRFTKGIDADLPAGTTLAPGASGLVVRNVAAFESRYGAGLPVLAAYLDDDKLSNDGENVKLSFGAGAAIREFTYATAAPWPTGAGGTGFSIALKSPGAVPAPDHNVGSNWQVSTTQGGTPGLVEASGFDTFIAQYFDPDNPTLAAPGADPDRDGMNNLLEYGLATIPDDPGSIPALEPMLLDVGGTIYPAVRFRRPAEAADLTYSMYLSEELDSWSENPGDFATVSTTPNGDGTSTVVIRATSPAATAHYIRLGVTR